MIHSEIMKLFAKEVERQEAATDILDVAFPPLNPDGSINWLGEHIWEAAINLRVAEAEYKKLEETVNG